MTFAKITTDSRKIEPGDLFIAVKGDHLDGHDFIERAFEKGALAVICEKSTQNLAQKFVFYVDSTLSAIRNIAYAWRRKFSIPIIAVGGSVGKTTTKEFLAAILTGRYSSVLKTQGSQNGFLGIPITLLSLNENHRAAVIEIGIDEPNAMLAHVELVNPTHSLLTKIAEEHLLQLGDLKTVAEEENILLQKTSNGGGVSFINLDDPLIEKNLKNALTYSLFDSRADFYAKIEKEKVSVIKPKSMEFACALPGEHNAQNLFAALSVALGMGLDREELTRGLKNFQSPDGRSKLLEKGKWSLFLDHYNASPSSMSAALKFAASHTSKPLVFCLGDMLELGPDEERHHRDLFKLIPERCEVMLYGPRMLWLLDEARIHNNYNFRHFKTHDEIKSQLLLLNKNADYFILIKGSRGMTMEKTAPF